MELIQQPSRNPAECNHQNGIDLVFPGADEGYQEDEDTDEEDVTVLNKGNLVVLIMVQDEKTREKLEDSFEKIGKVLKETRKKQEQI